MALLSQFYATCVAMNTNYESTTTLTRVISLFLILVNFSRLSFSQKKSRAGRGGQREKGQNYNIFYFTLTVGMTEQYEREICAVEAQLEKREEIGSLLFILIRIYDKYRDIIRCTESEERRIKHIFTRMKEIYS